MSSEDCIDTVSYTHLDVYKRQAHAYPRSKAAYPLCWVDENKFWPQVGRVDDGYGDRNLICSCQALYEEADL